MNTYLKYSFKASAVHDFKIEILIKLIWKWNIAACPVGILHKRFKGFYIILKKPAGKHQCLKREMWRPSEGWVSFFMLPSWFSFEILGLVLDYWTFLTVYSLFKGICLIPCRVMGHGCKNFRTIKIKYIKFVENLTKGIAILLMNRILGISYKPSLSYKITGMVHT